MRKEELLKVEVLEEVEAPSTGTYIAGVVVGAGATVGIIALT